MSYFNFSSFYPVDEFAFDYGLAMDQDLAPSHFLGDISISFDSPFFSGQVDSTGVSYAADYPYFSMDTMDYQESAGLVPHDSIVILEETPQPVGILAPLEADYVHAIPEHFDGEIPTQDTYWRDVKRYMDRHGRAPHINAFIREPFSFRRPARAKSNHIPSNIPVAPVRRPVAPLPKRAKQALSRSSAVCNSSDHTPVNRTTRKKKHVSFRGFVMVNPSKETPASDAGTEEPLAKKVKRELINSACTADDLPSFDPIPLPVDLSIVPSAVVSLPETMSKLSNELPSSPESTKPMTRKRKLDELKQEQCSPKTAVREAKRAPVVEKWEKKDESCSMRQAKGVMRYRCDLCHEAERTLITKTYGDMKRHLQSLVHQARDFECTTPGCDKAYTRIDALKRHMGKCKA